MLVSLIQFYMLSLIQFYMLWTFSQTTTINFYHKLTPDDGEPLYDLMLGNLLVGLPSLKISCSITCAVYVAVNLVGPRPLSALLPFAFIPIVVLLLCGLFSLFHIWHLNFIFFLKSESGFCNHKPWSRYFLHDSFIFWNARTNIQSPILCQGKVSTI